jgi:hypothetical protein
LNRIQPTETGLSECAEVFYRWQKEFFEHGAAAFQQRGRTNHQAEQERIAQGQFQFTQGAL